MGSEAESTQRRLIAAAYRHVPDTVIATLMKLIDADNAQENNVHVHELNRVELCWDEHLRRSLFQKLQDGSLKLSFVGELLETLVSHGNIDALRRAEEMVAIRSDDRSRLLARHAAVALWLHSDDKGWNTLWSEFQADRLFFRNFITDVAHNERQSRRPPAELSEEQLADLYILISQEFPQEQDEQHDGAHFVGPRESVQTYRNGILSILQNRGTSAACTAIERLHKNLPHLEFLRWSLREAKRVMLQVTWTPLSIQQFLELIERPASRLVRSGRELQQLVLESLTAATIGNRKRQSGNSTTPVPFSTDNHSG